MNLKWTTEIPKVAGWYFMRGKDANDATLWLTYLVLLRATPIAWFKLDGKNDVSMEFRLADENAWESAEDTDRFHPSPMWAGPLTCPPKVAP